MSWLGSFILRSYDWSSLIMRTSIILIIEMPSKNKEKFATYQNQVKQFGYQILILDFI